MRYILTLLALAMLVQLSAQEFRAGQRLSAQQVKSSSHEQLFYYQEIDSTIFERISGLSYSSKCTLPLAELRYLRVLHKDKDANIIVGELICNKKIADDLLEIFEVLYKHSYPIERMVLVDEYGANDMRSMMANNSSAFNFRYIAGTTRLSKHSLGMAIDINPLYNPYVKGTRVLPSTSKEYTNRDANFDYKITRGDICHQEFIKRGFIWGGGWLNSKDYQHFEKR